MNRDSLKLAAFSLDSLRQGSLVEKTDHILINKGRDGEYMRIK